MNLFNTLSTYRISTSILLVFVLLFIVPSCSRKIEFETSSVVPAARGTVKVKSDDNKNNAIKIELINLAEPERLDPPHKLYMVWMTTDQGVTKNLGQIKTSTHTFSKTLKASFEAVTTFVPSKIFITAEDNANVETPGWPIVLSTNKF
jgi:uncharacterized protein YndB with AHSA1/START domain